MLAADPSSCSSSFVDLAKDYSIRLLGICNDSTLSQHSYNSLQYSRSRRLADITLTVQLTPQRAQDFYGEHKGKDFFETLVNFMTSGPVYALVLARQNAIKEWRSLMGPTNSNTARAEKPKRYSILHTILAQRWLTNFLLLPL